MKLKLGRAYGHQSDALASIEYDPPVKDHPVIESMLKDTAALIVRRVNQGPAFDRMEEALGLWLDLMAEKSSGQDFNDMLVNIERLTRAALKLAREVK